MFVALKLAACLYRIRHIHMGGLAVREGRHAKVGLFAGAFAVEYLHQAFFLFGKPVAADLKTLFLGLDGGCVGADVQDEFLRNIREWIFSIWSD